MNIYTIDGDALDIGNLEEKYLGLTDVYCALKRNERPVTALNNCKQYAVFVHVTDVHGDQERLTNAVEIANALGADALINTGDSVYFYSTDALPNVDDVNVPYLITIGNHDSSQLTSEQAVYNKFIAPYASENGYILDTAVNYPTYYYRDFPERKLRVFCLNDYQVDGTTSTTVTKCMYQAQLDWFCTKLLETPADYGIICAYHAEEHELNPIEGYDTFMLPFESTTNVNHPISDIVDAYISGASISESYSFPSPAGTVTVSANFSNKNSGTEFIAHIFGHGHTDRITWYADTVNAQLAIRGHMTGIWLNKNQDGTDGTAYFKFNEYSDLARIEGTKTENAFNVYIIDRDNKVVKVVRIGARLTTDFRKREHMAYPYDAIPEQQ